jgi:hypothetical protein
MKSDYVIVSYPRSGSNYFQLSWKEKNKQHIDCLRSSKLAYKIEKDEKTKIIGLIRTPINAISSRIIIGKTHETAFGKVKTDFAIEEYIELYHFIIKNADFIVDISDLDKVDKIIETISGLNSEPVNTDRIKEKLDNMSNYSPTFANHEDYESIINILKDIDTELCHALYDIAYAKRLMV